jgi:hypothetical protein
MPENYSERSEQPDPQQELDQINTNLVAKTAALRVLEEKIPKP